MNRLLVTSLLLILIASGLFSNESKMNSGDIGKNTSAETGSASFTFQQKIRTFEFSSSIDDTFFLRMGISGTVVFATTYFLDIIMNAAIYGVQYSIWGTGDWRAPAGAVVGVGFIPMLGPFIQAGILGYMTTNRNWNVPETTGVYAGVMAVDIIFGITEIAGFILMVAGFVNYHKVKNEVAFRIKNDLNSLELSLAVKL